MVYSRAPENVEPKHKMYLNTMASMVANYFLFVEPKHKMYLNPSHSDRIVATPKVEPKHKMYLNGLKSGLKGLHLC